MPDGNLFSEIGELLVTSGYDITPIRGKAAFLDDWEVPGTSLDDVRKWAKKYPSYNIGIKTRNTPAIDIDVYDADAAAEMEAWVLDHLSDAAPVRVGQAPKRLILFRADAPFRKLKRSYVDEFGTKHSVEILGDGQQFVAFGIHPDTKKPFEWVSLENPLDVPADALKTITAEDAQAVMDAFSAMAERRGWKPYKKSSNSAAMTVVEGDDDALLLISQTVDDYDDEDVRDALTLVDGADDYDHWLQVGMALHHQYSGDDKGLELWHEWSEQAHNYASDALDAKWKSFEALRNSGKATTLRYILKHAKEGAKQKVKDEFERVKNIISTCNDVDELFNDVAAKVRDIGLQPHQLEKAATLIQVRAQEIDGVKMPISKVRTAITKARKDKGDSKEKIPDWVSDFVWLENDDCFYCLSEHKSLSIRTYNARYDRNLLTPEDKALGRAIPEQRAADVALTTFGMPHVDGMIYLPGCEQIVSLDDGGMRVNIYDDRGVPLTAEAKTADQKAALRAVLRHFEALFPDERERNLILSFLAYQVQCPADRVNWAILIQGEEGAGKTWMQNLMAGVLGRKNVGPVNATSLFADFNGWAEGRKMIFIEEIRIRGHDRYEVLEKIKTNITNDVLEITRKGRDPYSTPNVSSYVMFTNYADALSLSDGDRRYCIVRTAFQSKLQIENFIRKHPDHFAEVFNAVAEHADVMRGWLMSWKLSDEFDPKGRAPMTYDKAHMRDINMSDEQEAVVDIIEAAPTLDCSNYLLSTTTLTRHLLDSDDNVGLPKTSAMRMMLEQMGFRFLGRHRVDGKPQRFYTRRPDLFPGKDQQDIVNRIKRIMDGEEPEFL